MIISKRKKSNISLPLKRTKQKQVLHKRCRNLEMTIHNNCKCILWPTKPPSTKWQSYSSWFVIVYSLFTWHIWWDSDHRL